MEIEKKIWEDMIFPKFHDTLLMHFAIPKWDSEDVYQIAVEMFWKRDKHEVYVPENLFLKTPRAIHYVFKNGIEIKGTLTIKEFSDPGSKDTLGIFGDFHYYETSKQSFIWHTEGFLISFDPKVVIVEETEAIIIVEEPVIIKAKNNPPLPENPKITPSNTYSDLFPYIYVSGWPRLSPSEKIWNFFTYNGLIYSPPFTSFTDQLSTLKAAGNRKGMQSEALLFVEGSTPYQWQYVKDVRQFHGYIGKFLSFYNALQKTEQLTHTIEKTCLFFNTDVEHFSTYLHSNIYMDDKAKIWESYFALIILPGYENDNLEDLIKVLILCNFLEIIFEKPAIAQHETKLQPLFEATVVLNKTIFPLPPYPTSPSVKHDVLLPYAIGDLQLVQYKLLRYEIGELASITSIMAGEKRKLVNRKLDRVVDQEMTKETTLTNSENSSNEQNNDFNEELWNAIAETTETTNYPDSGLISTYGPPTDITIKGTYTRAQTTQTPDKKQLSSFAKKILNRTTQRMSEKIKKVRAHTALKEMEDTSVSFLNNAGNKEPVYGVYCWLNKIYQAKLVNYGNRMLFSFMIPVPAAAYIRQTKILDGDDFTEPKSLQQFKVYIYKDITTDNYLELCNYYHLKKFRQAPQASIVVSDVVNLSQGKLIPLPEGYYAESGCIQYAFGAGSTEAVVNGFLGQNTFSFNQSTPTGTKGPFPLAGEEMTIAVSAVYNAGIKMSPPDSGLDFQMSAEVTCQLSPQSLLAWQIELYQLLIAAYDTQLEAYNLKINTSDTKEETINPLSRRLLVKQELEKGIRRQLLENALEVKGLPLSLINAPVAATAEYNQPQIIQYLNTAMEWNEMSYTFFDQYQDQNESFAVASLSPDFFSAFLKAGYARVIIPVNPLFNYGFLYFLNTGNIWYGEDRLAPCFEEEANDGTVNPDQLSVVYELKKTFQHFSPRQEFIDEWEVMIPTSMQILQNKKSLNIKGHE